MKASIIPLCLGVVLLASPATAAGDAVAGAAVFRKCASCHTAEEPVNKVGPSLLGVIGRQVASIKDYAYSPAMMAFSEGGKVWDEALFQEYIFSPKAMVQDTRMTFAGLKKPNDILDLLAYLEETAARSR